MFVVYKTPAFINNHICVSFKTYQQRMEKKKFDKGQHTSLTRERKRHLESIGFRWAEPKGQEAWEKRYHELVAFKAKVCNAI